MSNEIQTIPDLSPDFPYKPYCKLTVPLVAAYLARGTRQVDIARATGKTRSSVSEYIKYHYDELAPLVDDNSIMVMKSKHIASQAQERLSEILDETGYGKKHLVSLNIVAGTHIDKFRLQNGQSTASVTIDDIQGSRSEIQTQAAEIRRELKRLKRDDKILEANAKVV